MAKTFLFNRWQIFAILGCVNLMSLNHLVAESETLANPKVQQQAACGCALYYLPNCPFSQKVLGYLYKIHKTIPLKNVEKDFLAKQTLKEVGGKMIVPCLIVNGQALYDSDRIIHWLSNHQDLLENET